MARRKKTDLPEAPATTEAASVGTGGGVKKARAPRRKPAVARIPEEVTVDFHGVREQLAQSTESAREAQKRARGARHEAGELREHIREVVRGVETEANGAIVRINRARDQAEEAARLSREAEEKAKQATRAAEHALHTARETTRRLRGLEEEHQEAWAKALAEISEDIRLVRQRPRSSAARGESAPAAPGRLTPPPRPGEAYVAPVGPSRVDEPPLPSAV